MPNTLDAEEREDLKQALSKFLPEAGLAGTLDLMGMYNFQLRVSKPRRTKLGDYRPPQGKYGYHRISVNGDLNPYAFLWVLVHEVAHLAVFEQYKNRVKAHGVEWQTKFQDLMMPFINAGVFPDELSAIITESLKRPPASSCADVQLMKALKEYDATRPLYVEDLDENELFRTSNGKVFRLVKKVRKRYFCIEVATNKRFAFSPITEVSRV